MVAYFKCLCGDKRKKAKQLESEGYEIRITNRNSEHRKEALSYKAKLPFKITNEIVEEI